MQIKDKEALTFPGKLKGDPNKRLRNKYYCFHRDHRYDTTDCYDLKQQIEALITQVKLQRFVSKRRADPPQEQAPRQENKRPRLPIGDIRIIVGGTAPKMAHIENHVIGFSEEDARRLHHPHDDALVVSLRVGDYNMHRVLVDNGSSANILYYSTFQQMRIDREQLVPINAPFVGFRGTRMFPIGAVTLSVTVGDYL